MNSFLARYFQQLPKQSRRILQTCFFGIGAGLVTVVFQVAMNGLYRGGILKLSTQTPAVFISVSFLLMMGSALVVGWLLNSFCSDAKGSGIPQLKVGFWKDFGFTQWRVAWVKFIAGVLSIGSGASLGREGPSVQIAGALASNLALVTGEPKQNHRAAVAAGGAAGLAAAFNTPLAAVTFMLEEVIGDLNSRFLGGMLLASVIGALVVHGIIGQQPAFMLVGADKPSWAAYALTPLVAVLASVVGIYFQKMAIGLRGRVKKQRSTPIWLLPVFGALITWILGVGVFEWTGHLGVFGLGYDDLSLALQNQLAWKMALLLLFAKFIATTACYGFEGCGGIFSPMLFLGGMVGVFIAKLVGLELSISRPDTLALAVVGMSACLSAVVWAPVTGILIVFEMTHEFALVPMLMLGALLSQTLSRKMNRQNFYDTIIDQDGVKIEHAKPPRDLHSWQSLPVSAVANFQPVFMRDLTLPERKAMFEKYPYGAFPVFEGNKILGILTRTEFQQAGRESREPLLQKPAICQLTASIREIQSELIHSNSYVVLLSDASHEIKAIVTLHDLLRAEMTLSQAHFEEQAEAL